MLISHSPHMICVADMSLDRKSRRLQMNGTLHQLRPIACQILAVLMSRAGQTIPREELFRRIWRTSDGDNTRALDVHIAYLRRELEADPRSPRLIVTERGVGYCLKTSD
jgi:DNA-binding response OmpR family regulator